MNVIIRKNTNLPLNRRFHRPVRALFWSLCQLKVHWWPQTGENNALQWLTASSITISSPPSPLPGLGREAITVEGLIGPTGVPLMLCSGSSGNLLASGVSAKSDHGGFIHANKAVVVLQSFGTVDALSYSPYSHLKSRTALRWES